jgi:signal transduction histidine kinase
VELRRDPVRVDDIVRNLLPTLQSLGERRNVRVVADLAPALPRVPADRTYLHEALSILLRSAVERTADGGEVHIQVESVAGLVRLRATHGAGMVRPLDEALVRQLSRAMRLTVNESGQSTTVELAVSAP